MRPLGLGVAEVAGFVPSQLTLPTPGPPATRSSEAGQPPALTSGDGFG